MKVLIVRNVQEALPRAIEYIRQEGIRRESRNGPVLVAPGPVSTVYEKPCERVLFWEDRDANPFFHLYEALWMLAGRDDVKGPARFAKNIENYSDDGETLHGAYGHRWRKFPVDAPITDLDQLPKIAENLRNNPEDRRSVLQMWDVTRDLWGTGKDLPCNVIASFQRGSEGELNLVVFCRSNDIIWGAYGANAVHFSFLLEYMAAWIGCPVGTYTQVSVNWHAYLATLESVKRLTPDRMNYIHNPYEEGYALSAIHVPIPQDIVRFDKLNYDLLEQIETGFTRFSMSDPFFEMAQTLFRAHHAYKSTPKPDAFGVALDILQRPEQAIDWVIAAREWMIRRETAWWAKNDHKL